MTSSVLYGNRCRAEVDFDALRENLAWIRHRVGPTVKIMTVVKADAYGHGLRPIATCLMQSGTDIFGVANLPEAQSIRSVGPGWPVLMLGACLPEEVEWAVRDHVQPTISTMSEAQAFSEAAVRLGKTVPLHIKVDTGMGRLGVRAEAAFEVIQQIRQLPQVLIQGVYTHFSSVEDDAEFSRSQAARFQRLLAQLRAAGIEVPFIHASSSGALLFEHDSIYNTVRPGLIVYGIIPPSRRDMEEALKNHLRPALTWKSRVSLVKDVPAGTALSYGKTFVSPHPMRIATITAGYGDGYLRAGSNRACVLIGGKRCRIVGRITMDQMLADVTEVPEAKCGDEVVFIGQQGNARITANDLADWFGTVAWEVLTNITYRVPRIYRGSSAA